jgi:hypothetical protein
VRERTLVKELGKLTPYVRKKECQLRLAAVNWPNRLFTKNTGHCKHASGSIVSDACPVLEGQGEGSAARRSSELKPE